MIIFRILCVVLIVLSVYLVFWQHHEQKMIYLDNNGTTFMYRRVIDAMYHSSDLGNASGIYADRAKQVIEDFKKTLSSLLEADNNDVVVVSGGSEANNLVIRGVVDKWWVERGVMPHVMLSSVEHKTSIMCCEQLEREGRVQLSLVPVGIECVVRPSDVADEIRDNTCLVSVMQCNNETGAVNDVAEIARICKEKNVPFHSDIVQMFGKVPIKFSETPGLSAVSISMHKLHGPVGIGALVTKIPILPQIGGVQNSGLRGGTENVVAIAGALECLRIHFVDRAQKNARLRNMTSWMRRKIREKFPDTSVIYLSPDGGINTLLLSVIGPDSSGVCNIEMRKNLLSRGVIVSIGSTCNTNQAGSSHVLKAMGLPEIIRKGVLRISVSDMTDMKDCERFVEIFTDMLYEYGVMR